MCLGHSTAALGIILQKAFSVLPEDQCSAEIASLIIQQQVTDRLIFLGRNSPVLGVLLTVGSIPDSTGWKLGASRQLPVGAGGVCWRRVLAASAGWRTRVWPGDTQLLFKHGLGPSHVHLCFEFVPL